MDEASRPDEVPEQPREPVEEDDERGDAPPNDELSLEEAGYGHGV